MANQAPCRKPDSEIGRCSATVKVGGGNRDVSEAIALPLRESDFDRLIDVGQQIRPRGEPRSLAGDRCGTDADSTYMRTSFLEQVMAMASAKT
jgi:hypothetical protein